MLNAVRQALGSKKFLAAVLGAVLAAVGPALGLSPEAVEQAVQLVTAYVLGQGIADWGKSRKVLGLAAGVDASRRVGPEPVVARITYTDPPGP